MLAIECEDYHALPVSGGVWEQPAGLLKKMRQVNNVYRAYSRYEEQGKQPGNTAKWKKDNQAIWDIIEWVEELKAKQNG